MNSLRKRGQTQRVVMDTPTTLQELFTGIAAQGSARRRLSNSRPFSSSTAQGSLIHVWLKGSPHTDRCAKRLHACANQFSCHPRHTTAATASKGDRKQIPNPR